MKGIVTIGFPCRGNVLAISEDINPSDEVTRTHLRLVVFCDLQIELMRFETCVCRNLLSLRSD